MEVEGVTITGPPPPAAPGGGLRPHLQVRKVRRGAPVIQLQTLARPPLGALLWEGLKPVPFFKGL